MMASTTSASQNNLSRELLRWIQSLDLAYAIKNVKRDFSNGFLIAEILSRYFDRDISMHSYDNGISKKSKKDNWEQLNKFFSKVPGLEDLASKQQIDAIIHSENGAAVMFLNKLYTKLTQREVQEVHPRSVPDMIPPYAKPTGTAIIREKMKSSEMLEQDDETTKARIVRDIHDVHEEGLQMERNIDPDRFSPSKASSKVHQGFTRPVGRPIDETPALAPVKEVQVKTLSDKQLAQLRAAREESTMGSLSPIGISSSKWSNSVTTSNLPQKHVMELLDDFVTSKLSGHSILTLLDRQQGAFQSLINVYCGGSKIEDGDVANILTELIGEKEALTNVCLEHPKDFWKLFGCLFNIIRAINEDNSVYSSTASLLSSIGKRASEKDSTAAALLMTDFALPKLAGIISTSPRKCHSMLQIIYAFCDNTVSGHIEMIKHLRDQLPEISTFIYALSILVFMEKDMDETMLDLYHYYYTIGLDLPSETIRAACIAMLVSFLEYDRTLVLGELMNLKRFSYPSAWWEVKAQLIVISSTVLLHPSDDSEYIEAAEVALFILKREFHVNASLDVRRVGLSYVSKNLASYQELVPIFVDVLLSIPSEVREHLLATSAKDDLHADDDAIPFTASSTSNYQLNRLPQSWDSLAIARQMFFDRCSDNSNRPDYASLQVICACFNQLAQSEPDQLGELYEEFKDYVIRGLCSESLSGLSAEIMSLVSYYATSDVNILNHEALVGCAKEILSMVSNIDVGHTCQDNLLQLLKEIWGTSVTHASYVRRFMEQLRASSSRVFEGTLFEPFDQEITSR